MKTCSEYAGVALEEKAGVVLLEREKDSGIFEDNLEHLQALEHEAKIRVVLAYLVVGSRQKDHKSYRNKDNRMQVKDEDSLSLSFLELSDEEITIQGVETLLEKVEEENKVKAGKSVAAGIELNFVQLCEEYKLDYIERIVVMLFLANNAGTSFRAIYEKCKVDRYQSGDGRMSIEALLSMLSRDYREQIRLRKYFSVKSTLLKEEILVSYERDYDSTDNILDTCIYIHERIVRYLLGDDNVYNTSLFSIVRGKTNVSFDRVVMCEQVKEDILQQAVNYSQRDARRAELGIDEFYDYGTGLTFLFHGPSGTGKTMLAKALANKLDKELLSFNASDILGKRGHSTFEDVMGYVFKEARLSDGIVFLDECDDTFSDDSYASKTLLLEIERAQCITILATNKPYKLDPSLERRITMKVPFSIPIREEQEKIWKALVPANVKIGDDVDFKCLSERYLFTGGLIKNTIYMAINAVLSDEEKGEVVLTKDVLEKAAEYQSQSMCGPEGVGIIYLPSIKIEDLTARQQEKKRFYGLVSAYKRLEAEGIALNMVLGASSIDAGISVVDAIAKECGLNVKKAPLGTIFSNDMRNKYIDPFTQKEISPLEYFFATQAAHKTVVLLEDRDSLFARFMSKGEDDIVFNLNELLRKLRSYKGLFFLVTSPLKGFKLPIEFSQYLEVRHPSLELQLREWESLLPVEVVKDLDIVRLVEQYPLHLEEIDLLCRQANIRSYLSGDDGIVSVRIVQDVLAEYSKTRNTPVLFGDNSEAGLGYAI